MSLEHLDQFDESDFDENYEIIKANQTRYYSNLDGVIINRFDDTFHSKFNCQKLLPSFKIYLNANYTLFLVCMRFVSRALIQPFMR